MTNRRWKFGYVFGFILFGVLPAALLAQPYNFATLNFKVARGINDGSAGPVQIVGDSQELIKAS